MNISELFKYRKNFISNKIYHNKLIRHVFLLKIIGYVELALFLLDGFLHFRVYRSGGGDAPPPDTETGKLLVIDYRSFH